MMTMMMMLMMMTVTSSADVSRRFFLSRESLG
jgi:hypothetical protein